jgi:hypothetical protein
MQEYLIVSPHKDEDCLPRLDELSSMGEKSLEQWHFGCMAGDHTGYAMIEAESEDAARQTIPPSARPQAKVIPLTSFTPEQIKSFHQH